MNRSGKRWESNTHTHTHTQHNLIDNNENELNYSFRV